MGRFDPSGREAARRPAEKYETVPESASTSRRGLKDQTSRRLTRLGRDPRPRA